MLLLGIKMLQPSILQTNEINVPASAMPIVIVRSGLGVLVFDVKVKKFTYATSRGFRGSDSHYIRRKTDLRIDSGLWMR